MGPTGQQGFHICSVKKIWGKTEKWEKRTHRPPRLKEGMVMVWVSFLAICSLWALLFASALTEALGVTRSRSPTEDKAWNRPWSLKAAEGLMERQDHTVHDI